MTQKLAFLFPGQGSQAVGMGKELADKYPVAREVFAEADGALGYSLSQLCFEGPEEKLKLTEITRKNGTGKTGQPDMRDLTFQNLSGSVFNSFKNLAQEPDAGNPSCGSVWGGEG